MKVKFTRSAERDMEELGSVVAARMMKKILWHAENNEKEVPLPLSGRFKEFYKWRVGDWRVIYSMDRTKGILVIEMVGHRREIYRK